MANLKFQKQKFEKPADFKKSIKTLLEYSKKYYLMLIIAIFCAVVGTVLSVLGPNMISSIITVIEEGISPFGIDIDLSAVARIGFILIALYGFSSIFSYVQGYIMAEISCKVTKTMRTDINKKITRMPLKYFDTHNHGDTLSRVTNDVDTIAQSLNMSVGSLISGITMILGCILMMFITQWTMALVAIGATVLGFILMAFIMSKSQKYFITRQKSLAEVNDHIEEYYSGQNVVRSYNAEEQGAIIFEKNNENLRKQTFKAEFFSSLMMPLMTFIGNLGYVAVCIVGAALAFNGTINFAVVVAFILYVRLFTSPLGQMAQGFSRLQSAVASSERVFEFLNEEELTSERHIEKVIKNVKGKVEFKNISFGYDKDKTIIKDFSIKINPGQKVAIVGPTGAGKTTIVNLLMRFYELDKGKILVDGISISDLKRKNVHSLFGMVLQDTWLFEGTLRENLSYSKQNISDEKLMEICADCGLEHFINTLPNKFDTMLNDTVTVSTGQKQLLTIARAMVQDAPMLILDEATSSVDTFTEMLIQKSMDKLTKGRTSFVIAHRLSTIRNADMIIYMENGEIKETGTHKELLEENGLYANLYNSQFMPA
ncbi:MAG: ABC transporter ATP-binding protein [Clostridia bacterium]|nr:ABC transporter ATP-binding protein [Clostridia bacterium]